MSAPRGLSAEEAAIWARLAQSVTPLDGRKRPALNEQAPAQAQATVIPPPPGPTKKAKAQPSTNARPVPARPVMARRGAPDPGLDSHWDRKLRAGSLTPDFTLDLHEHNLDAAYTRLLGGLDIARETGARVVLVIAGRERPTHAADRADRRGAIRAKLLDWLAASRHASAIAAIRKAHRRHGGEGALYLVLRRQR